MVRAAFSAEGPCPASPRELQACVLRFICGASFGPLPVSVVGLNADLRRAFQRAGHERAALGIFRAGSTADAVRSIHTDLRAAGCAQALVLEDGAAGDDLLILDADRSRLRRALAAAQVADGGLARRRASEAPPDGGAAPGGGAHAPEGGGPNGAPPHPAGANEGHGGAAPSRARQSTARPAHDDDDDELMRLLAEPTVKKKDWGCQVEAADGQEQGETAAPAVEDARERSRSRRRRRRRHRSSSSDGPRKRRRHRRDEDEEAKEAAAATGAAAGPTGAPQAPGVGAPGAPAPGGGTGAPALGLPPPGSTFVFTPDAEDGAQGDIPLPESAPRRSVSSVPLFEWVSADSVTDLGSAARGKGGKGGEGKGKGRRSRSRGERREEPVLARGERPAKLAGDAWEEPRCKTGLELLGESSDRPWRYLLRDEARRSFAGYLPRPLAPEDCRAYFERIRTGTEWEQPDGPVGMLPRRTCWMVSRGCTCTYRYGGIEVPPREFPAWMQELLGVVMPLCGIQDPAKWPNSCNLNLYDDGGMSVGWHSDDERLFQGKFSDCQIISLSLGASRRFDFRLNWPEEGERQSWQVHLGDGDMLTMEGMMQKHFQHRVPREENITAPRINLTWRWVARHAPRCPVERQRRR